MVMHTDCFEWCEHFIGQNIMIVEKYGCERFKQLLQKFAII